MSKEIITELEVLFTANTQPVDKAAKSVQDKAQKIERNPVTQKIDGDAKGALDSMDRVEAAAKKIVSAKTVATVDANISKAELNLTKVRERLEYLHSIESTMEVTADIKRAETALRQIERRRDGLVSARESMVIDADIGPAERALHYFASEARQSLGGSGGEGGKAFMGGLLGGLAATPIAGAVVGLGRDIADAFMSGFDVEARSDRLMATTGLDEATVGKLARAAGEAYASNWGESLEANMSTARVAIQQGLLDPKVTARASEQIIASLSGVADMMGGDVSRTSQAAATLIRSGLAKDAAGAFDIIVKGMQAGNDKAEDWLDTLIEYPSVLEKLGLTGAEMTGLIAQGLSAGARNSDIAADALKEFQIRATDASTLSTAAYQLIGLNAEEMTAKIAAGGAGAREGLDQVLDGLRAMEDPVARNAAAVGLFGTKAEDMGDALFAMDLSNAVEQLGAVEGAAASALGVLGDNAASDIASAQRNIEVAADGIKGALAAAFNPQIEDFATFVSSNREQVMQFLLDIANGGIDAGRAFLEGTAAATEGVGGFVGGPMADLLDAMADMIDGGKDFAYIMGPILGVIVDELTPGGDALRDMADQMRGVGEGAKDAAEDIRTTLIENALDPAQEKLNDVAIPLIAQAALHDATVRLAADIDGLGVAADQSQIDMQTLDLANLTASQSGQLLAAQLLAVRDGLVDQALKAQESGATQAEMTAQYDASRQALMDQLTAMGLTQEQASVLIEEYGQIPANVDTLINLNTTEAERRLATFKQLLQMPDVVITADMRSNPYYANRGAGSIDVKAMGAGAVLGAPLSGATVVPPNTWRVVGDRPDVPEIFAPLDGSARSWAILMEGLRRMPGVRPMADGDLLGAPAASPTPAGFTYQHFGDLVALDPEDLVRQQNEELAWNLGKVRR